MGGGPVKVSLTAQWLWLRVKLVTDGCPRRLSMQVSSEGRKAGGR